MHRRSFLKTSALLPVWYAAVARAQEVSAEGPRKSGAPLQKAWEEARRTGRPLLVLLIPPIEPGEPGEPGRKPFIRQSDARQLRGRAWAQVVEFGSDEELADLSLCVLACATPDEAQEVLAEGAGAPLPPGGDSLALLVESDLGGVEPIDLALEPIPSPRGREARPIYEKQVRERVAAIGAALRAILAPNPQVLARRAAQVRRAFPDLPEPLLAQDVDGDLRVLAARAPAVVREAAEHSPRRNEAIALLAELARADARAEPPAGALWGESTGCGTRVEGLFDTTAMISCGMGHVPKMGRRFLFFYTAP